MTGLYTAVTFLTRVPLDRGAGRPTDMVAAVPWFPVVGVLVGLAELGVFALAIWLTTPFVAAVLAVATAALITGAFHHDGLADMADAFGGGWTREQRLEILKDSRLGTYGVTALTLALALEIAVLSGFDTKTAAAAIVAGHALSRAAAVGVMGLGVTSAAPGLGSQYAANLGGGQVVIGLVVGVAAAVIAFQVWAPVVLAAAALTTAAVVQLARSKIGGVTGDVLGAIQQLSYLATLVVAAAIA